MVDSSNNPIKYDRYSSLLIIRAFASSLADIMKGNIAKKRKKVTKTLLKKQTIKNQQLAILALPRHQILNQYPLHRYIFFWFMEIYLHSYFNTFNIISYYSFIQFLKTRTFKNHNRLLLRQTDP